VIGVTGFPAGGSMSPDPIRNRRLGNVDGCHDDTSLAKFMTLAKEAHTKRAQAKL
jgi:hypothetical protein